MTPAPARRLRPARNPEAITMTDGADRSSPGGAVVVMNPRSGGGKVARFRLVEQAQAAGAQVRLTGPDQDAASLAAAAITDGATILGAAGGDGTVAAVAAEAQRPLVVMPAGTRNHFARDLGLNIRNPAAAMSSTGGVPSAPHR
jgi:diacylglycerol kinase family enzyme